MRRPAIPGNFRILVVPVEDLELNPVGLTIPLTYVSANRLIRAVVTAENNKVGASSWAFTQAKRKQVCKNLRALADFIEKNAISD